MMCYQPMWLKEQKIFVPCGHCLACRYQKSREWSARLLCELPYHDKAGFITLTYSSEFLPEGHTLVKSDLQKFWKRLRKNNPDLLIKYFACGEYGKLGRPHYHAVVFGLGPNYIDRSIVNSAWQMGRTSVDYCNRKTINYVTGYVMKKYSKEVNKNEYTFQGKEIPFSCCSRGLGLDYAVANGDNLSRSLELRLSNGQVVPLPRYFVKKLGIDTEELKAKGKDSFNKYVSNLFNKLNIDLNPCAESLAYMLYKSRDFNKSDALNDLLISIDEQKRYSWESRAKRMFS